MLWRDCFGYISLRRNPWWRHQMETFSALLVLCAGNSPVTGEFPTQRPVTRSFDVFFDLRLNERLSKQSWGWWFETPSCSLWRHSCCVWSIVCAFCFDTIKWVLLGQIYIQIYYQNLTWTVCTQYTIYMWWFTKHSRTSDHQWSVLRQSASNFQITL